MLIITDSRCPSEAIKKLKIYGEVISFQTRGILYEAISGHPDIFFIKTESGLILAPNLPDKFKKILNKKNISFFEGENGVDKVYPQTAAYNAVITEELFIHNLKYTDKYLLEKFSGLEKIHVNQAYTRCNLLALKENHFITSDHGIERVLKKRNLAVLYINPEKIILPGMKNGFFGGCCGIHGNTIFIIGNLDFIDDGKTARKYIADLGYELIELYDGPLFDGGGLIFLLR